MISFVFPQEKKEKKISKNKYFLRARCSHKKIYGHIGEEIKMMDLLADVCVCLYALWKRESLCVFGLCRVFGCYNWCIVFLFCFFFHVHFIF